MAFEKLKQILDLFLNMNGQYIGDYAGKSTIESCMVLVLLACSLVCMKWNGFGQRNISPYISDMLESPESSLIEKSCDHSILGMIGVMSLETAETEFCIIPRHFIVS